MRLLDSKLRRLDDEIEGLLKLQLEVDTDKEYKEITIQIRNLQAKRNEYK